MGYVVDSANKKKGQSVLEPLVALEEGQARGEQKTASGPQNFFGDPETFAKIKKIGKVPFLGSI